MIISEKLYQLRNRSGLSQEELAEKMHVSRQSISKWESGGSIPTIEKILELSKIYGVSTDFLLQDEMEEFPGEVIADENDHSAERNLTMQTATDYLHVVKISAGRISLGVMLCILSPVILLLLEGMSLGDKIPLTENMAGGLGIVVLLCMIAAAVALFILNSFRLKPFEFLETEVFHLDYGVSGVIEREEHNYLPVFARGIAAGVTLCIIAVIPLILVACFGGSDELAVYMTAILLLLVACGVYVIVFVSIRKGAYSRLLQKDDYDVTAKRRRKKFGSISSVYWTVVTALYLGISFWKMNWQSSWVIWPVAGVLYATVYSLLCALLEKE